MGRAGRAAEVEVCRLAGAAEGGVVVGAVELEPGQRRGRAVAAVALRIGREVVGEALAGAPSLVIEPPRLRALLWPARVVEGRIGKVNEGDRGPIFFPASGAVGRYQRGDASHDGLVERARRVANLPAH
ncbi:MAG: hypothetical protein HQ461_13325 [Deltaproteobacteria bacterium]|nr:hypothetical protein [Deltaproteobacteria bacterium]